MTLLKEHRHSALQWVGTFSAALFGGGALGVLLVLPLGLAVDARVIFPLALIIAALFAGICASMVNNSAILKVVGISTVVSALLIIFPIIANSLQDSYQWYARMWVVKNLFIVAFIATVAALRVRNERSEHPLRRNGIIAICLIGVGILVIIGTIYVASLFGLTGA